MEINNKKFSQDVLKKLPEVLNNANVILMATKEQNNGLQIDFLGEQDLDLYGEEMFFYMLAFVNSYADMLNTSPKEILKIMYNFLNTTHLDLIAEKKRLVN